VNAGDTMTRDRIDLDGEWRFVPDPERMHAPDRLPDGDPIHVPGCWEAQVARPYGIVTAWYRRRLATPAAWTDRRVVLHFQAVMYRCAVFIDGRHIGGHEGGYTPFELDATAAIQPGQEHELAVYVVNPLNALDTYPAFSVEVPRSDRADWSETELPLAEAPHGKQTWYSSQSGIWSSVYAEARPLSALQSPRLRPDVPGAAVVVGWSLDPTGEAAFPEGAALRIDVEDGGGRLVASLDVAHADLADSGEGRVELPGPRLWEPDDPHLYRVTLRLLDAVGGELDAVSDRFGMREISTANGRLILNGRPIFMVGVLDQDHYPTSISTPPDRAYLDEQMRLTREMGINLLRCHIKVPDPAYLEAADEAGILVWCELPNWSSFTERSSQRGRETLDAMVEALGNHPSVIIWTIINEDWGTDLRHEARDRRWLREMVDHMRALDPSRLVVDNSACETVSTPNFHLDTDLADFHVYFLAPDNAVRWRNQIADFARRPRWMWSPHGDKVETGEEPLILSEFGSWGLPRLDRLVAHTGREPWWFATGRDYYRPSGLRRRFEAYGLARIWPSVEALAEATQWHQFEALQYQVGQMRRHDSINGFVYTELTDAYWEANGLLDPMRGTKVYHERLPTVLSPDVIHADIPRRDLFAGDVLRADLTLAAYGAPSDGGEVRWTLHIDDELVRDGRLPTGTWPEHGSRLIGRLEVAMPEVAATSDAILRLEALDAAGTRRASDAIRLAILPTSVRRTNAPLRIAVHDPYDIWAIDERMRDLGHEVVPMDEADLLVTGDLTPSVVEHIESGGRALVLVRSRASIPADHDLARRVAVHLRRLAHSGWPGQRSPWEGDWVTSWSWILPDALGVLPRRAPLDFAYEEVLPDHVLLGHDPIRHRDEVSAGMFVGWVHAPAAVIWSFKQGAGTVTLTTFRLCPERGPVATALLEELIQRSVQTDRRVVASDRRTVMSGPASRHSP
jgi:hypothetical protein